MTQHGYKKVSELKVNDTVYTKDGSMSRVVLINDVGIKECNIFSLNDCNYLCLPNNDTYCIKVGNTLSTRRIKYMTSDDIVEKVKNYHTSSSGRIYRNVIFELCKPIEFGHKEIKIDPYVIGALIGDGYIGMRNLAFINSERDVVHRVQEKLPETCELKEFGNSNHYNIIDSKKILRDGRNKKAIRCDLEDIGLLGSKSNNKFIPDIYKFSDIQQRIELMRGLVDTDGEIRKSSYQYTTISKNLAIDIKFVIESLGGKCSIQYYKGRNSICYEFYTINFRIDTNIVLYSSNKHRNHMNSTNCATSRHIMDFEAKETHDCTEITFFGANHSALTNNFIPIEVK